MSVQPDELIAAALRQDPGAGDGPTMAHLTPEDAETLGALRRVVAMGRAVTDDDLDLDEPPQDLWSQIEVAAFEGPAGEPSADPEPPPVAPDPVGAQVIDLAARRARRVRAAGIIGAVAAVAVLVAAVGGVLVSGSGTTEVVASADLSLLAGGGSGTAELVERDDGLYLVVDVSELEPAEEADFFELWMLAPDVSNMASMTKFTETSGTIEVPVPEGVDTDALPVVDISEEIDDGDDTHSGLSILRGELT
jgi:hypothetical protein